MTHRTCCVLSDDDQVFARFQRLADSWHVIRVRSTESLQASDAEIAAIDTAARAVAHLPAEDWRKYLSREGAVILSSTPDDDEGLFFLEAGAAGYCHAYAAEATLRQVLEVVASGEKWVGRSLLSKLLSGFPKAPKKPAAPWRKRLSQREQEVVWLAAQGRSNLDIGQQLGITERTVKAHVSAAFGKLEVEDRLQLALVVHGIRT